MAFKLNKSVKASNYLELVPIISTDIKWKLLNDGCVELTVRNKGFINKFAQTFFSTPEISKIKLDKYGSCVWKNIDGKNSIGNIALKLKESFGEKAEPLYGRIIQFTRILKNEGYIKLDKNNR